MGNKKPLLLEWFGEKFNSKEDTSILGFVGPLTPGWH